MVALAMKLVVDTHNEFVSNDPLPPAGKMEEKITWTPKRQFGHHPAAVWVP